MSRKHRRPSSQSMPRRKRHTSGPIGRSRRLLAESLERRDLLTNLVSFDPAGNVHNAPADGNLTVTFDQTMHIGFFQGLHVHSMERGALRFGFGQGATATRAGDTGNQIVVDPTNDFKAGERVQVIATTFLESEAGVKLTSPKIAEFRVAPAFGSGKFVQSEFLLDRFVGALGDLDQDGDLDLVNPQRLFLNDGTGNFTPAEQYIGNPYVRDVQVGDADKDGDLDIFMLEPNGLTLLRNDGSGSFSAGASIGDAGGTGFAIGDVLGNGDLDVVITYNGTDSRIYRGDGFNYNQGDTLGSFMSTDVSLGDLDGDGDLDTFMTTQTGNRVAKNTGVTTGAFTDTGQSLGTDGAKVELGDLDNDGDLDAFTVTVTGTTVSAVIWSNDGTGVFSQTQTFPLPKSGDFVLGDFDADGDLDAFSDGIFVNDGQGMFTDSGQDLGPLGGSTSDATAGDVDGDGDIDIVAFTINPAELTPGRIYLNVPTVTLSVDNATIPESGGPATFTATLSRATNKEVSVSLALSGTATTGLDYSAPIAPITIPAGQTTGSTTYTGRADEIDEPDETLIVDIFSVTNAVEDGVQQQTTTIIDDDEPVVPTVTLTVDNANIAENAGLATFTATLSAAATADVTVDLGFTGTATNPADYTASTTQITIATGATTGTATVTAVDDATDEPDETVIVDITAANGATENGEQQATTTITDDDEPALPTVALTVDNANIAENAGVATFTATLSAAATTDVTVDLGFTGTATNPDDYTASATQITIATGATTGTATVTAVDDATDETDETVIVDIVAANGATENGEQQATTTITDDDEPALPTVALTVDNANIAENGGVATFTATLSAAATTDVTVDLGFTGTAATPDDYTASATQITIATGATTGTATVTAVDDATDEPDETVIVDITAANGATENGEQQATTTITDDDEPALPTVTLTVDNANIAENGGVATFTATLSAAATADVTVDLGLTGTATNPDDYTASATQITIATGATTGTATVTAVDDATDEPDETVIVDITAANGATENGEQQATTTITDDDEPALPTVTLSVDNTDIAEAGGVATLTATLSAAATADVTVDLGFTGTATTPDDYTASATQITIAAGATTGTATVTAVDDLIDEQNETVIVDILAVNGATENGEQQATTTITDDDDPALPTVTLSVDNADIAEAGGVATFTATLSAAATADVTVDLGFTGTAANPDDYTASATQITIATGATTGTATVTAVDDATDEPDETVIVDIVAANGATENGEQQVTTTITDDDDPALPTVTLSVDNTDIAEAGGVATFTATLSAAATADVTVDLGFTGTATTPDDYTASATQITIAAGATTGTATVTAIDDAIDEQNETVIVDILAVNGATENGEQQATTTITDDDDPALPTVTLSVDNADIAEAGGVATFTATLSAAATADVTVDLGFTGTAANPDDYTASATQITIATGATTGTATVTAVDDATDEPDETVIVDIVAANGATESGEQQATTTITDDDDPALPTVTLSVDNANIAEAGGVATLTATLTAATTADVTVDLGFTGTATNPDDYTASGTQITIATGATSGTATVTAIDDAIDEENETVIVDVLAVNGAAENGEQQVATTITDDDDPALPTVTLSVDSANIAEAGGVATFTVTLSAASEAPVTVDFGISGSATAGDYTASATQVDLAPGETSVSITVTAIDDAEDEPDETVVVDITNVLGATEDGEQQQTTTITDDDNPALPTVSLAVDNTAIAEAGGVATFTATLSAAATADVTVDLGFAGTATSPDDYTSSATQITIATGATSGTATVTAVDDVLDEENETVVVDILSSNGATEDGDQQATTTITDDDDAVLPTVSLTVDNANIAETGGVATFTVTLSAASTAPVTVEFGFGGSASAADYTASATEVNLAPGETTATITVTAVDDAVDEPDETVVVDITNVLGASEAGEQQQTTTITDDDGATLPLVTLSVDNPMINEGDGVATFTATLSAATTATVTIELEIAGPAFPNDYTASATQIVIPAGQTTGTMTITPVDDTVEEDQQTVVVSILSVTNATEDGEQVAATTIIDNDGANNEDNPLGVLSLLPTTTGFIVEFSEDLQLDRLNLYDSPAAGLGPADVLLTGQQTGPITGSLVLLNPRVIRFVASGGLLPTDTYDVTLRSGENAFIDVAGMLLDGNNDGTGGDDFAGQFAVLPLPAETTLIVSLPDFVRGPGQEINVPATQSNGIPLTLSDGANVGSVEVSLTFDPNLFELTGASVGPDAAEGAQVSVEVSALPGGATVRYTSANALAAGPVVFAYLQAIVPNANASDNYRRQHVVDVNSVNVTNVDTTTTPALGDDAVHAVVFPGDTSANGRINALDATLVAQRSAQLGTGFGAMPNTDPMLLGDISGNNRTNAFDATLVARHAALFEVPEIPAIPGGILIAGVSDAVGDDLADLAEHAILDVSALLGRSTAPGEAQELAAPPLWTLPVSSISDRGAAALDPGAVDEALFEQMPSADVDELELALDEIATGSLEGDEKSTEV